MRRKKLRAVVVGMMVFLTTFDSATAFHLFGGFRGGCGWRGGYSRWGGCSPCSSWGCGSVVYYDHCGSCSGCGDRHVIYSDGGPVHQHQPAPGAIHMPDQMQQQPAATFRPSDQSVTPKLPMDMQRPAGGDTESLPTNVPPTMLPGDRGGVTLPPQNVTPSEGVRPTDRGMIQELPTGGATQPDMFPTTPKSAEPTPTTPTTPTTPATTPTTPAGGGLEELFPTTPPAGGGGAAPAGGGTPTGGAAPTGGAPPAGGATTPTGGAATTSPLDDLFPTTPPAGGAGTTPATTPPAGRGGATEDPFGKSASILREVGGLASEQLREWVDDTGRFKTRARLISLLDGHVRLIKENGRTTTVPLNRLSQNDLEFVNRQASAQRATLNMTVHTEVTLPVSVD
jgi:hypothetical protein